MNWVFGKGGYCVVHVGDDYSEVRSLDELPSSGFRLVQVGFQNNPTITDDDLKEIARFPFLGFPDLQGTGITGSGFKYLSELTGVEGIWLSGCKNLDSRELRHIEGFKELINWRWAGLSAGTKR
jgi:hypothetical protein